MRQEIQKRYAEVCVSHKMFAPGHPQQAPWWFPGARAQFLLIIHQKKLHLLRLAVKHRGDWGTNNAYNNSQVWLGTK